MILGDRDDLVVGNGHQVKLGEHQGLGYNVHQDFVALQKIRSGCSTLVLNQRGAQASSSSMGFRSPLPELVEIQLRVVTYDYAHQIVDNQGAVLKGLLQFKVLHCYKLGRRGLSGPLTCRLLHLTLRDSV